MPETKWGIEQISRPAPLWYRRLTNACILCFIPMYVGIIQIAPMSDAKRNIYMGIATAIPFLLKGIGMVMGNGQYYVPSNETIDKQNQQS